MKKFFAWYLGLGVYYQMLPFLVSYSLVIFFGSADELVGDEGRYLWFANNILNGFYSTPSPDFNLWAGPGYPIFLSGFVLLKFPIAGLRLLNGLLMYFSLIISHKTLSLYGSKRNAFMFTFLLGLYVPMFQMLTLIYTECLTWFLMSAICFLFLKAIKERDRAWKLLLATGATIAFLTMTKVIFGYVIVLMIFVSLGLFAWAEFRASAKKSLLIFILSFAFCLPWLGYTYGITGKLFYWTNSGSMSLYTMSTPYANELGDWKTVEELQMNPNHEKFMDSLLWLNKLERDEAYKAAAVQNIKSHPMKYFSNWVANVGRLLFSYPFSATEQTMKTYVTLLPNMFVVVFIVLTLFTSVRYYKVFPEGFVLLFFFIIIYLFGSTLVSAYRRMFSITMPFWFFYFSFVFGNIIQVSVNRLEVGGKPDEDMKE